MARKIDRVEETVAEVLTRLGTLQMSDRAAEREAGIPQGFLKKLREGKNRTPQAAENLSRLVVWLATTKAGGGSKPEAVVIVEPGAAERVELAAEIRAARTMRRCGRLLERVAAEAAEGKVPMDLGHLLEKLIARRMRALKEERDEKATAQVRALELLLDDEVELVRAHQAKLAGPSLKPGEAAPAPIALDQ